MGSDCRYLALTPGNRLAETRGIEMTDTHEKLKIKRPDPSERIADFFDVHPQVPLTWHQQEAMGWMRTDSASLPELHHQYVTRMISHDHQFADLLAQSPTAREMIRNAESVVPIGPGFGAEIDEIKNLRDGPILAVEKNKNAWPVLTWKRDWLKAVADISEVQVFEGPVVFTAVHVLRQPSLADDQKMRAFALELLRVAPNGFTLLSTLPYGYTIDSKFAPRGDSILRMGIDCDRLLFETLCELGANTKITTAFSKTGMRAQFAKIEVAS